MKKKTVWWIIIIIAIIIIFSLILKKSGAFGDTDSLRVAVDTASERSIIQSVSASGKIYPETEVKIKPDVSGEIVELPILEGDSVVKGQLLVRINQSIYNSAVQQAEASMNQSRASVNNAREMVEQAKAQMNRTQNNYNRNKQLFQDKVISRMEYEQSEADYLSAKANYEASSASVSGGNYGVTGAQANVSQARENLRRTIITAPTSGIISQLLVKKGERVVGTAQMDGTQIMTIADLGKMEVRVDVSETDISKVNIGDTSLIEVDAYRNQKFKGIVSKISVSSVQLNASSAATVSTDQVTNYTVHILILPESYASIRNQLGKGKFPFKPGMTAGVEIQTQRESGILTVPINAVTTRDWPDSLKKKKDADASLGTSDIRQVVFVYDAATKTVKLRDVKTGIQDNEHIQILSGLKKGEVIVAAPYGIITRDLADKKKVKIVPKDQIFEAKKDE
jgi:HlyD family secretion protein